MAGSIVISSIKLDTDNNFSIISNTGTTLLSANASGLIVSSSIATNSITSDKIVSVANTKIAGMIEAGQIASVNASVLSTGTVPTSRMPTYVASVNGQSGTVTVDITPNTTAVLAATAGASVDAVGTYGSLIQTDSTTARSPGYTTSGSVLSWAGAGQGYYDSGGNSGTASGTWRLMGYRSGGSAQNGNPVVGIVCVWLRIS